MTHTAETILHIRSMRNARAIIRRLDEKAGHAANAARCHGICDGYQHRAAQLARVEEANRRYWRAFNRYHNIMRPAAMRRVGA